MSDALPRPAPRRPVLSHKDLVEGVRRSEVAVLARALTLIESKAPRHQLQAEELLTELMPDTGNSIRVGVTGTPGAGKSTFIESLGMQLARQGRKVAVLAVDPSSGVTGGSILGDKTRMTLLASEPNAFIRPAPSAGTMGGVARKTRESMLLCEAAGYEVVLIETVGVGQSETMVSEMTDCFLAVMIPGAGDELQGIKRGLLELVDVIAVNKADGANKIAAETAARQYRSALQSLAGRSGDNAPDVVTCSALQHEGIEKVWGAIERRVKADSESGALTERRQRQNVRWLWSVVEEQLLAKVTEHPAVLSIRDTLEKQVEDGTLPIEAAARRLLDAFETPATTQ